MKRFGHVFLSPIELIDCVRTKPNFWVAILAMMLLHTAVSVLHVALVDHKYFAAEVMSARRINFSKIKGANR